MGNKAQASAVKRPSASRLPPWHAQTVAQAARALETAVDIGLSASEVAQRSVRHGPNEIRNKRRRSPWRMLFDQFADFMILVLIAAAVVSGVLGDVEDTIAIAVIVLLNAVVGFVQEYRAEQAIAALKKMAASHAQVVRDGVVSTLPASELVPGDVVLLEAGNVVPADLRLVEAVQLKLNEAALTGESQTAGKSIVVLTEPSLPLGDRKNIAFKGTVVTYGRGRGIVAATGMDTELGKIAALLEDSGELKTPLQRRLAQFGKRLAIVVLAICAIVFAAGLLRGEAPALMFLTAVSLAVAAIPEALPAIVTIALAFGARKMVTHKALIRRLPAVETLGSITYICSDKTGTLTQNRMKVEAMHVDGGLHHDWQPQLARQPWPTLLTALAISNDASQGKRHTISGDPTEVALFNVAAEAGFDKAALELEAPRLAEIPFDAERKRMMTFHREGEHVIAFVKGSPESVLPRCTRMLTAAGEGGIDTQALLDAAEQMAADGLRVLAVAARRWDKLPAMTEAEDADALEADLLFLGLVGLQDPPRHEAKEAVHQCKTAGIVPVMITGDHPATARAIAMKLGIIDDGAGVMTGHELTTLDDAALQDRAEHTRVYARVDPEQKIRIVKALQARGELVAMTGDGVNDAPALKRADIGVAMGKGGTDVAREASSLVLLDDNFVTIVAAVREGRRIFDNIRKFIKYAMTGNSGEILTIFLAPFMGLPIPLLPIHILWVNLVTDGLPGLAFSAEPAEKGLMKRPPRSPQESIFAQGMWQHMLWAGLLIAAVSVFAQVWAIHTGSAHWQTMVFTVLTLSQMGHVLAIRSDRESLFARGLLSNRPMLGAVSLTFVAQMATIYVPVLNPIFRTQPLSKDELAICLALSSVVWIAVEMEKWMIRHGWIYGVRGSDRR